jgi:putative S-adenosyl-L-methionine-dependent methyltransferase
MGGMSDQAASPPEPAPIAEPAGDRQPELTYVLEADVPLSQSMVWRLQRTFYSDQGIEAWSRSKVPQSITTSPVTARAYARVVFGYLRDIQSELDPSQPVYIVELGAGSGRFAYRFLKAFTLLVGNTPQRFVYVMTDASPSVLDFWRNNPRLRAFVDAGMLDFAHFDLVELKPLELLSSGATLRAGGVANPVVLIANYIFDSIPQDAYTIKDGRLYSGLVSIRASTPELDLAAPQSKVRIGISFTTDDVATDSAAEADPLLREILERYRDRLDDTTLLIPRAAMACVRFFHDLARQRALCLVGDFGDTREEELHNHGSPGFGAGGSLWLPVNFHALSEYAVGLGGRARHPRSRHLSLNVSMLLFGSPGSPFADTQLAYDDAIEHSGPDDLSMVIRGLAEQLPTLRLEFILALLRTTGWDSDYLGRSVPFLIEGLATADRRLRAALLDGLRLAWEQYYPIGETDDIPFGIGALLYTLEQYADALQFFELSLREFGEDPRTTLNLALTLYRLERLPESLVWLDRTLELDPTNELANKMRPDVAADLAAAG